MARIKSYLLNAQSLGGPDTCTRRQSDDRVVFLESGPPPQIHGTARQTRETSIHAKKGRTKQPPNEEKKGFGYDGSWEAPPTRLWPYSPSYPQRQGWI